MNYVHRFDTWNEFIERLKKGKRNLPDEQCSSLAEDREEFFGTSTFTEAMFYLTCGWDAGLKQIEEIRRQVPANLFEGIMPVKDYRPELQHTIAGGVIDVATHLSGASPETFLSERPPIDEGSAVQQGRKLQTIYVMVGNLADYSPESFMWRGALTYLLVEHLENCGYSCEVWAFTSSADNGMKPSNIMTTYHKVKEFSELFDSNKAAVALASAFMFRRFVFGIKEMATQKEIEIFGIGSSYGSTLSNATLKDIILPEDKTFKPIFINIANISSPKEIQEAFATILSNHINNPQT